MNRVFVAVLAALVVQLIPVATRAQDSLRVLRIQPSGQASRVEPVVILFDHPVAPRLDQSLDPARVLRITPAVGARMHWRDPSTIIADFDSLWAAGARYEVRIDPTLKSAGGLALAGPHEFVVRVRMPRLLTMLASSAENEGGTLEADTNAHPVAVFDARFDLASIAGRVWFVPHKSCGTTDSLALRVVRMRDISTAHDSWAMREAGGYERDQRLDSLRRVIEFAIPGVLVRGCHGELRLPAVVGDSLRQRVELTVRPPFRLADVCADPDNPARQHSFAERTPDSARRCGRGTITIQFTNVVTADEVRAHVLVNGQPVRVHTEATRYSIATDDSIRPNRITRVTVQSALRNTHGEPLGHDTTITIRGSPLAPSVGYATERIVTPRSAPNFLRIRHVNTDSVVVVISRVPDSLRSSVLSKAQSSHEAAGLRWRNLARDTVVHTIATHVPADSERVINVPTSWIPLTWRNDPLLLVRAEPWSPPAHQRRDATRAGARTTRRMFAHVLPGVDVLSMGSDYSTPLFAIVQRSDIEVHVVGSADVADVWVTSLSDALPRAGVTLRVLDDSMHTYGRAITDARGRATLRYSRPRNELTELHIEAALGGDRALLMLTSRDREREVVVDEDSLEIHPWYGATSRIDHRWLHGSAFTERGIYRPGERVYFGGAVRTFTADSGYRTPAGDSARWSIWNAGERLWSHVGRLSDFGSLADSFPLKGTARLGEYAATLALRAGGAWRTAGRARFRVAEYRAPEFAVQLSVDTVTPLFAGDTARVRVDARYLFGLPMSGSAVRWWWDEREEPLWQPSVPGLERYTVGRSSWRMSDEPRVRAVQASADEGVLGADGTLNLRIPTRPLAALGGLDVNVTVTDANRQAVTKQFSLPLHAADAYVGMRKREQRWVWQARDSIAFELFVVRADGTPRVGDTIAVVAQRSRWIRGHWVRDTVWRTARISAAVPVSATFRPPMGGSYELLASVVDERGRRARSGLDVWVAGADDSWARSDPRAITLRSERPRYAPGDTVSLAVESPAEQRAWISLRREGILHEQVVDLHAGINAVYVPVPVRAAPNAEIRVIAIRPYGALGNDTAGIYFRAGSLSIAVDPTPRSLRIAITPEATRYRPGDTVRVYVDVRDTNGKATRAEATVWAVDEGVVSLTGFQRPDVLSMFLRGTRDDPWQSSTLMARMLSTPPAVAPMSLWLGNYRSVGSVAANSALSVAVAPAVTVTSPVRHLFATTPFFSGSVHTDANGRASVAFTLPDNVGTFRLYAAAVGDDVYAGSADTSVISTRPLLVRAALPRVVRVGDTLFAGAVITQEATSRTPVSLSITTTNATVSGRTTQYDTLDAQRAREMRFPINVTGGDTVVVMFRGNSAGASPSSDGVEARLAVSPPGRARAHVATGMFDRAEEVSLAIPDGTDTLRSHVSLQLGVSVLPLVRQFSEALRSYPYSSSEQLSSAGRSLIARVTLQRALGDSAALTAGDRAQLETSVTVLLGRQRADGGYGYWSAINWTSPWLTAYVFDFLVSAHDVGIAVPASTLERAKKYLAGSFPRHLRTGDNPWLAWRDSVSWPHEAMAVAHTLRRAGVADTTLERDLWGMRGALGFEERLELADAFAVRGDSAKTYELMDAAWRTARVEGRRVTLDDSAAARSWVFRSTARPLALLLATTARLEPKHPLLGALFESVVQTGQSERARWWNTLDQAEVSEALTAAALTMELSTPRHIAVSGPRGSIASVVVARGAADSLRLAMSQLSVRERTGSALRLNLASTSNTPTYFAMTLFEVPVARPVRADDKGIGVERWYESYDGGMPIVEAREGDLVRVRLRITAPADREFVVIDDALPAGLEAVDLSLRTSASLPPYAGAPRLGAAMHEGPPGQRWLYGSWDGGWWTPWEHKEIRDDRVLYFARQLWKGSYQASYVARATTVGTFVRPPAEAEEMYNPAVHGRSDGGSFTVTRAPR